MPTTRKPSSKPKAAVPVQPIEPPPDMPALALIESGHRFRVALHRGGESPTKRAPHRPPHEPTKVDRDTVSVMVAGGIAQADIASARGISVVTLRKHYKAELANGMTALNTIVIIEHVKRIKAGDFQAIKWWEQSRMGWNERIIVDDGKPADTPMRVIVEFVGEAAPPEQSAPRLGSRLQLVG